jgi:hypothetical protein
MTVGRIVPRPLGEGGAQAPACRAGGARRPGGPVGRCRREERLAATGDRGHLRNQCRFTAISFAWASRIAMCLTSEAACASHLA